MVATALDRITQEALTNVAKRAEAARVSVLLEQPDGQVRLIVEDDGRGFDLAATGNGVRHERRLGLASMRERAALVAGTLEVESSPGRGTAIYVRVPLGEDVVDQVTRARGVARAAPPAHGAVDESHRMFLAHAAMPRPRTSGAP